jgi:hypothetical protein
LSIVVKGKIPHQLTLEDSRDPRGGVSELPDADTRAEVVSETSGNTSVVVIDSAPERISLWFLVIAKDLLLLGYGGVGRHVVSIDRNSNIEFSHGDFETLVAEQVHSGGDVLGSGATDEVGLEPWRCGSDQQSGRSSLRILNIPMQWRGAPLASRPAATLAIAWLFALTVSML